MTHLVPVLRPVLGTPFRRGDLYRRAGEVPSFHIAPARTRDARDLITGSVLGTYNSASPAWAVGPDGVLFQPAANAPVIEYDPVTLQCLGARIWGVVTNRELQSSDFATTWTQSNVIVSANAATAPDGTQTADQLSPTINGTSITRFLRQDISTSVNDTYTLSVFVKVNTLTANGIALVVQDQSATNTFRCNFNLFTPTTSVTSLNWATPTASIIAYPNGWYRCSVTGVTSTAHTSLRTNIYLQGFTSVPDTTGSVFLWGAQLNTGPLAPYVPTTTTAASSTADVWTITGADAARIINTAQGTLYVDFATGSAIPANQYPSAIQLQGANRQNEVQIYAGTGIAAYLVKTGNVTQAEANLSATTQNGVKSAFRYAENNSRSYVNGSPLFLDTVCTMPATDRIFIGSSNGSENFLNGYIREAAIIRSGRADANLQAMTQ